MPLRTVTHSARSLLGSMMLMAGSITIGLVILEIFVRLLNGVPIFTTTNFVAAPLDLIRANTGVMVHDESLGWRLKDNLIPAESGLTTGAYGLRMNEAAVRTPPRRAILAVGDSFTAGSGVSDDQTWPAQLERLIGTPVLNGGVGAYGVDQMVLRAEHLAMELRPSTLIVGILSQDTRRNSYEVFGGGYKPWFDLQNGRLVLKGVPVPRLENKPVGLGVRRSVLGYSYLVHWSMLRLGMRAWWIDDERRYRRVHSEETGVAISCGLMERLNELRERHAMRVIVVMFWGANEVMQAPPPWYGPPVLACARDREFETLDMYGVLREIGLVDQSRFASLWLDEGGVLGHPSPEGYALTARHLAEVLSQNDDAAGRR